MAQRGERVPASALRWAGAAAGCGGGGGPQAGEALREGVLGLEVGGDEGAEVVEGERGGLGGCGVRLVGGMIGAGDERWFWRYGGVGRC